MSKPAYYVKPYNFNQGGYPVHCRIQADIKIAVFVCDTDAQDFCDYRNWYLDFYDTTDTSVYEHC